ncbi:MAG: hypothetical protein AAF602_12055 [Myxococcota bacterium]
MRFATQRPDYRDVVRSFLNPFMGFVNEPARARELLDAMVSLPAHVIRASIRGYVDWDSRRAAAGMTRPLL